MTISSTNIDDTKPVEGNPTTQSVRDNFTEIKTQFDNAQTDVAAAQADATSAISDLATHEADTANPHTVTPAQLGLVIGTDVQAEDATLTSIAALGTTADRIAYTAASDVWAESPLSSFGRTLIDDADAFTACKTLQAGYVVATKAAAEALTPLDGQKVFITSDDGGEFTMKTGASAGTYNDNGGSYTGTQFTAGDGSSGFLRGFEGLIYSHWFMDAADGSDQSPELQNAINAAETDVSGNITAKSVYLTDNYSISTGLILKRISLISEGQGGLIARSGMTGTMVITTSGIPDSIRIGCVNIELDGNGETVNGIQFNRWRQSLINCYIHDVYDGLIIGNGAGNGEWGFESIGNTIIDCANDSLVINSAGAGYFFADTELRGAGRYNVRLVDAEVCTFDGCKLISAGVAEVVTQNTTSQRTLSFIGGTQIECAKNIIPFIFEGSASWGPINIIGARILDDNGVSFTVTGAVWSSSTATLTLSADPSTYYAVGGRLCVRDITPSGYNGFQTVTAVTSTTISYAVVSDPGAYSTGGIAAPAAFFKDNSDQLNIIGCHISTPGYLIYAEDSTGGTIDGNNIDIGEATFAVAGGMYLSGARQSNWRIGRNVGITSFAYGDATISSGNTSTGNIAHGLFSTPTFVEIMNCNQAAALSEVTRSSTNLKFDIPATLGSDLTFTWRARIGYY